MRRPCLDCGEPAESTRCPDCTAVEECRNDQRRGTPTERGYDARWYRLSARARRLQPFCADCGSGEDLTADHKRWPARTLADVEVVCRSCNSKRGPSRSVTNRGNTRAERRSIPAPQASSRLLSGPFGDSK